MLSLTAFRAYTAISNDTDSSEFVRAYAGAGYIGVASSSRIIDQQRTSKLFFERVTVDGVGRDIACGIARKSKGGPGTRKA